MDLEIVNDGERGLIARDRETGEEVPVPIDELDVKSTYSESVNTGAVNITDGWAVGADYIFATYDAEYLAINGHTGKVFNRGSSFDSVVQSAIDAEDGGEVHFHFANANWDDPLTYISEDGGVTVDLQSTLWTGSGKNKAQISLQGDHDVFTFESGSKTPIHEFRDLKLVGNKDQNASGSGVVIKDANEFYTHNVEFRSFPDHGVKFDATTNLDYNRFSDTWFLDSGISGCELGTNGGSIDEMEFIGCEFVGGRPNSYEAGHPAVRIPGGADVESVNISGGMLRGGDVIRIEDGVSINITGLGSTRLFGDYAISVGEATSTVFDVQIEGCNFINDTGGDQITNYIKFDNATNAHVVGNELRGASGDAITWTSNSDDIHAANNRGFTTEYHTTATIDSGSTEVAVEHGLDVKPDPEDIVVSPHSDLGAASYWYHDSISANFVSVNVDADPTQSVDFAVQVNRERLDA